MQRGAAVGIDEAPMDREGKLWREDKSREPVEKEGKNRLKKSLLQGNFGIFSYPELFANCTTPKLIVPRLAPRSAACDRACQTAVIDRHRHPNSITNPQRHIYTLAQHDVWRSLAVFAVGAYQRRQPLFTGFLHYYVQ